MPRNIEPIFAITTPIRYKDADGGGTGFFFNYGEQTYIITNRHVVDPDDDDCNPTEAYVWFRDATNHAKANRNIVRLVKDGSPRWRGHPQALGNVDLAIIPIGPRLNSIDAVNDDDPQLMSGSLAFTSDHIVHENVGVDQRVTIVGYPGDFIDRSSYFPVCRNALIASPYGFGFENNPYFVTDARMHPGTSGSPVVMQTGGMQTRHGDVPSHRNKSIYLLGIHSTTFYGAGFSEQSEDEDISVDDEPNSTLDLNVAWYPELLLDIFNSLQ